MKNLFDHIFCIKLKKRIMIIGFSPFALLILMFSFPLIPFALKGVNFLWTVTSSFWQYFFSFLVLVIIAAIAPGCRIIISSKKFKFWFTIFGIPVQGFSTNIKNVNFSSFSGHQSKQVKIFKHDDPWGDMGFYDWVSITYDGKQYEIGSNANFSRLFRIITKSIKEFQPN